jgi:hypothetical protein
MMNDTISRLQEWLVVFGYLAFAGFVIWQVFNAKK